MWRRPICRDAIDAGVRHSESVVLKRSPVPGVARQWGRVDCYPQRRLHRVSDVVHSCAMKRVGEEGSGGGAAAPSPTESGRRDGPRRGTRRRSRREWRRRVASAHAADHGGVVHRRMLRKEGISRDEERSEVRGDRWTVVGRHTIYVGPPTSADLAPPSDAWPWHRPTARPAAAAWAVWESGSGALLDGTSALIRAGLCNFDDSRVHVTVPRGARAKRLPGVLLHRPRQARPSASLGLPAVSIEVATLNAAQWAVSDRQAALLLVLPVQQRLTTGDRLLAEWSTRRRIGRAGFISVILRDVTGGAEALGELDFARLCREHGVPEPTRQVVRRGHKGRIYLDVQWEDHEAGVEIDGGHHGIGLKRVEDALRDNELVIAKNPTLRIPVLGLRTHADAFMSQVKRLLASRQPGGPR